MADQGDEWAAPGGFDAAKPDAQRPTPASDTASADEPPRYGERIPGWQPPAPMAPAPQYGSAYVPPPKPGLFPLHPLGFGTLLGAAFATIRWNPKATILPAVIVAVVQVAVTDLIFSVFTFSAVDRLARSTASGLSAIQAGTIVEGALLVLLSAVVSLFGGALLQGIIVVVVARGSLGQRPPFGEVFRRARRSIPRLVLYSLTVGVAAFVAFAILVGVVAIGIAIGGLGGAVFAVLAGVVGGLGFTVLYVWIGIKLALVPSIIVLERRRVFSSIARSWRLTRQSFWRTFGLIAVTSLMVLAAASIISVPFQILGSVLGGTLIPDAGSTSTDPTTVLATAWPTVLLSSLPGQAATTVVSGIGTIAQVAAIALVYLDLRMRREGLDIELQGVVESDATDADPFLPPTEQWAPPSVPTPPAE